MEKFIRTSLTIVLGILLLLVVPIVMYWWLDTNFGWNTGWDIRHTLGAIILYDSILIWLAQRYSLVQVLSGGMKFSTAKPYEGMAKEKFQTSPKSLIKVAGITAVVFVLVVIVILAIFLNSIS